MYIQFTTITTCQTLQTATRLKLGQFTCILTTFHLLLNVLEMLKAGEGGNNACWQLCRRHQMRHSNEQGMHKYTSDREESSSRRNRFIQLESILSSTMFCLRPKNIQSQKKVLHWNAVSGFISTCLVVLTWKHYTHHPVLCPQSHSQARSALHGAM